MKTPRVRPAAGRHPIRVAARRAGLTPEVIRAWEARYGVTRPARSTSGRRLYSDDDVERLALLRRATGGGRSIGQIAGLATRELADLVAEDGAGVDSARPTAPSAGPVADALAALRALEADRVESILRAAAVTVSAPVLIETVLVPLLHAVGDEWHAGRLGVAHEHIASAIVRGIVAALPRPIGLPASAPLAVVVTPAGQAHELGAMMVAASAWAEGWRVIYLGASVPADQIAAVVRETGARLVALSITYAENGSGIEDELRQLRQAMPDVPIVAGGRASGRYRRVLQRIGATVLADTDRLRASLAKFRRAAA